jgi:hypothetical protein
MPVMPTPSTPDLETGVDDCLVQRLRAARRGEIRGTIDRSSAAQFFGDIEARSRRADSTRS